MQIRPPSQILLAVVAAATLLNVATVQRTLAQTPAPQPPPPTSQNPPIMPPPAAESTPVAVRGTRVRLVPPPGFKPAVEFTGFSQKETGASIVVTELPGPYDKITAGFTMADQMKKQGMTIVSRFPVTLNGQNGTLIEIRQRASGFDFGKWVVALGTPKETVLITAAFPIEQAAKLSQTLKAAVLTTVWQPDRAVPLTEGIRFAITPTGGLKLAKRLQNNLIYTLDAKFPSKSPDSPFYLVGPALTEMGVPQSAQEVVAKEVLVSSGRLARVNIVATKSLTIGGLPAVVVYARAVEKSSPTILFIHHTVIFPKEGFYLLQGAVSQKNMQRWLPIFEKMTKSFREKPDSAPAIDAAVAPTR